MYYFQVEKGKEERMARNLRKQYPEVEFTVPKKKIIGSDRETALLPGIVFADKNEVELMRLYRMKIVSSQEERRIARLSDQTPSTAEYDGEHTHFTSGPLVGSDAFVKRVNVIRGSVLLNMKLLGVFWDIWLECTIVPIASEKEQAKRVSATGSSGIPNYRSGFDWEKALAEQKAAKEAAEKESGAAREGEQAGAEASAQAEDGAEPEAKKAPEDFTEEERKHVVAQADIYGVRRAAEEAGIPWQTVAWWKRKAPAEEKKFEEPTVESREESQRKILARAELVGIHQAAKEAGVPWQTLAWWKKKMSAEATPEKTEPKQEPAPQPDSLDLSMFTEEQQAVLKRAEEIGVHGAAREAGIPWQTVGAWRRKAAQAAPRQERPSQEEQRSGSSGETNDAATLWEENRRLREKLAGLERKLERMRRAALEIAKS